MLRKQRYFEDLLELLELEARERCARASLLREHTRGALESRSLLLTGPPSRVARCRRGAGCGALSVSCARHRRLVSDSGALVRSNGALIDLVDLVDLVECREREDRRRTDCCSLRLWLRLRRRGEFRQVRLTRLCQSAPRALHREPRVARYALQLRRPLHPGHRRVHWQILNAFCWRLECFTISLINLIISNVYRRLFFFDIDIDVFYTISSDKTIVKLLFQLSSLIRWGESDSWLAK